MEYERLTVAMQREKLQARLAENEIRHFDHTTTLRLYQNLPAESQVPPPNVADEITIIAQLASGIATLKRMLAELPDSPPEDRPAE